MSYAQLDEFRDDVGEPRNLNAEERRRVATIMQFLHRIRTSACSG